MAESKGGDRSGGIGFLGLLAIVFITLKLTGHIAWSWWWVLAPLWGVPAAIAAFFGLWIAAIGVYHLFRRVNRDLYGK